MKGKSFIDTNIFVYSFDSDSPQKQKKANEIIKIALTEHSGCTSYQVIQEFLNVALGKFTVPLTFTDCKKYFDNVLVPLCEIYANVELYSHALEIMERWKFSFYDSLIIASAIQTNCKILFSEDFQHQQKIKDLTVINPFA